jgi:hypothetical protein
VLVALLVPAERRASIQYCVPGIPLRHMIRITGKDETREPGHRGRLCHFVLLVNCHRNSNF